jgi:hypothetical protein
MKFLKASNIEKEKGFYKNPRLFLFEKGFTKILQGFLRLYFPYLDS